MRFKIDWASLIVGSKFTIFALFYFVFEGNFPSTSPRGAYILGGDLTPQGFFALSLWGAYIWKGLYMEELMFGIFRVCRSKARFHAMQLHPAPPPRAHAAKSVARALF